MARRLRRAVGLPERDGLLVRAVEDGSPGDAAGLERGDLIVTAGGQPVEGVDIALRALDAVAAGGGDAGARRGARHRRARRDRTLRGEEAA